MLSKTLILPLKRLEMEVWVVSVRKQEILQLLPKIFGELLVKTRLNEKTLFIAVYWRDLSSLERLVLYSWRLCHSDCLL